MDILKNSDLARLTDKNLCYINDLTRGEQMTAWKGFLDFEEYSSLDEFVSMAIRFDLQFIKQS